MGIKRRDLQSSLVKFRLELHDSVSNEPAMFPAPDNMFYNYQLELTGTGMKRNLIKYVLQQNTQNLWSHTETVIKYLYMKITSLVVMAVDIHVGLHTHKTLTKESSDNLKSISLSKRNLSCVAGALLLVSTRDRH